MERSSGQSVFFGWLWEAFEGIAAEESYVCNAPQPQPVRHAQECTASIDAAFDNAPVKPLDGIDNSTESVELRAVSGISDADGFQQPCRRLPRPRAVNRSKWRCGKPLQLPAELLHLAS